ncbi:unnamed protein product [Toxocara canis]|uniref:G_PROTEIN_RECEP_F1_2 domain-containing protein n=1 Tax=Toxocara canis TaxID=6265 RepID=A0A183U2R6_TOXCA|nr:unnamed protein product [Toxocara canis]
MTILLFSIERYIAICHPMLFLKLRNVRAQLPAFLVIAWLIAIAAASPYGINHRADFMLKSWPFTDDGVPVAQSKVCMVAIFFDPSLAQSFYVLIHVSFVIFFAIPLLVILVVYALIAIKVSASVTEERKNEEQGYRITILLAAVVTSFFCCYLPFQLQRLLFFYLKNDSQLLTAINQQMYFISGFLFYFAPIVNPFLYNAVSKRFRQAFKEVLIGSISVNYASKKRSHPTT